MRCAHLCGDLRNPKATILTNQSGRDGGAVLRSGWRCVVGLDNADLMRRAT